MPSYDVTSPDGKRFTVNAPDGATQDQVLSYAKSQFDKKPSQDNDPSYSSDMAKAAGSGLAEGAIGLVTGPIDLGAKGGAYLANKGIDLTTGRSSEEDVYPPSLSQKVSKTLGVDYEPKTTPGSYAKTISSFVPAVAAFNPKSVADVIKQSVIGGSISETAGQATKGTWAEPWARVLGGITPSLAGPVGASLVRGVLRGNATPEEIERNMAAFQGAGTSASVGQATESYVPRAIESFLSKFPGSAGVMRDFGYKQSQELGKGMDEVAGQISPSSSGEAAGRAILKGITEDFIPKARAQQKALYKNLDTFIPPESLVSAERTMSSLKEMTKPIPGAKNLSETSLFNNKTLSDVKGAFTKDMGGAPSQSGRMSSVLDENAKPYISPGTPEIPGRTMMPYESLKELRTRIGEKLETVDLTSEIPKQQLKRLYGALTDDMKAAAESHGPAAKAAFDKANSVTKAFHEKIERIQNIIDKQDPEKVFRAAMSGAPEGATTLRTLMTSLPEEARKIFSAAVIRRLGRSTPSNQNDIGNVFSTNTFLTNWNKLSMSAKSILFDGYGAGFSYDMDRIAKVASNLKQGSTVFQNASGTAPAEELMKTGGTLGSALVGIMTGHPGIAGALGGGMVGANQAAKLMTNPRFVNWLAQTSEFPYDFAPAAMASLNYNMQADHP